MKQKLLLKSMLLLFALIAGSSSVWAEDPILTSDFILPTPQLSENFNSLSTTSATAKINNSTQTAYGIFNKMYNNNTGNTYAIASNGTMGSNVLSLSAGSGSPLIASITDQIFATKGAFSVKMLKTDKSMVGFYAADDNNAYTKANASVYLQNTAGELSIGSGNAWVTIGTYTTDIIEVLVVYNNTTEADSYGNSIALAAKTAHIYVNGTCVMNGASPKAFTIPGTALTAFRVLPQVTSGFIATLDDVKIYDELPTAPSFTITVAVNDDLMGSAVLTDATTITATPNSGYRVIAGTGGYTVSSGTATVTNNGDNTFTVVPTSNCTITINFEAIPSHTATFTVNGVEDSKDYHEGENIVFPTSNPSISGLTFMGWVKTPIVGSSDTAPASYETSGVMSTADVTYYAVFATQGTVEGNVTLTITKDTENFPTSYGTAKTFTEYTLEGKTFKIQQAYINSNKLQWRSGTDASNGAGTLYNTEALYKIQSIVLTYNGDTNKNFTVSVGDDENPSSGTSVDATGTGEVRTYDCSSYNKSYFVLTNGDKAGYLDAIAITYRGETTIYSAYRTTIPTAFTPGKEYTTLTSAENLDFTNVTGLEAYIATEVSGGSVLMTQVNKVPANTGLVLKATTPGSAVYVPVFDGTGADNVSANKMAGSATETTAIAANGGYILKDGVFQPALAGTLPAGKAYLNIAVPAGAPILNLGFDDATGINAVNGEGFTVNGEFYNLNGQRVAQPTKGLYIVNGKKYIVK